MFLDVAGAATTLPVTNDISIALINALVPAFLGVVTAVIGFVGLKVRTWVDAKTTDEQLSFLQRIAAIGVQAAEQLYGEAQGDEKKAFVLQYLQAELDKRGIKVDVAQLDALVEATVLEQFNWPAVEPVEPPSEVVTSPALDEFGGSTVEDVVLDDDFSTGDNS